MLFYVALTIAGVAAAAVTIWIFRSFMMAGRSAYDSLAPGKKAEPKLAHLNSNLAATPAPWGWGNSRGTPATSRYNRNKSGNSSPVRSKSRDWSQLEGYARSNEKTQRERETASHRVGSVRNVLTGYDMDRKTGPDTSSWPYQDSMGSRSSSVPKEQPTLTQSSQKPKKPWGW